MKILLFVLGCSLAFRSVSARQTDERSSAEREESLVTLNITATKKSFSIGKCKSEEEYDQLVDWPQKSSRDALNEFIKKKGSGVTQCKEANSMSEDTRSAHIIHFLANRYAVIQSKFWGCCGAHGDGGTACDIFDLQSRKKLDLSSYIRPEAKEIIVSKLVNVAWKGDEDDARRLTDRDQIARDLKSGLCPSGKGATLLVHTGPYAGGEWKVEIDDWKMLFRKNRVTEAMFGK